MPLHSSNAAPPPLLSHDSHTGYLTSSSPNIRATTLADDSALGAAESSSPKTNRSLSKSVTLPSPFSSRDSKPVKHNTLAIDTAKAGSSLSVDSQGSTNSTKSRSISPGSKLKDAFRPPRKNGALPSDNIERPSSSPGLSGFFNKDKTGNIASRRATKAAEGASSAQNAKAMSSSTLQSQKSIPSIVTPQEESGTSDAQDAPATTITPPTPVDSTSIKPEQAEENASTSAKDSNGLGNTVTHRRARSESASHKPSKLSQAMSAPLTPMAEEPKAMGSRNVSGNTTASSGGFFSSVFSAAQNAANTLSNTITNNQQRPRSTTTQSAPFSEDKISAPSTTESQEIRPEVIKPLAVDTIGSGDLSLSHLGISNDSQSATVGSASPASSKGPIERSRSGTVIHREEAAAREEDLSAARAISAAYGENAGQKVPTPIAEDPSFGTKTSSAYEQSINGDKTTPNGSIFEGDTSGLWRSGSLRNKVDRAKRRHRNSSGTTVGAGSIINNQGVNASPGNGSVPKLTGFAVASKKRNRDFHQLFRSVPEDDYLIEDYSCALQRDIILAGRIYISEGHICFSSNILGWVTTLVISFDEVVSVEKESTAMVFPNAIAIQTLHARHTFRSLLSRDSTYDLLIGIWKISHPSLQSSENGVRLVNGGTGSKTEKVDIEDSDDGSNSSGDNDDVYDEDEDDEDGTDGQRSLPGTADGSVADSEVAESPPKASVARKASALGIAAGQAAGGVLTVGESKAAEKANGVALASGDFPGPTTHSPTECADSASHYEKILKDEVIPAPLGKVYSMIFGATSGGFMSRWLLDEVKVMDLQMDDDKKGLNDENKTRSFSYIKPLTGSIGPRQTKCVITEQLDAFDLEKAVSVTVTTQTPDVPSGSVFSTKTRYCLMWGPNNGTRLIMCCMIEWTGKSWIKGEHNKLTFNILQMS